MSPTNLVDSQILIAGLARSGTTWLAKLLDSHPATLYRHEPDRPPQFPRMPVLVAPEQVDRYGDELRQFIQALPDLQRIRTSGTWPVFRKVSESFLKFHTRRTMTAILRLTERKWGNIRLPEVIQSRPSDRFCLVWKSVWSVGRLGAIAEATQPDNVILLLRHPCGVIASRHRGIEKRKMSPVSREEIGELLADRSQTATQLLARIDRADPFDVETFRWALLYSKAIDEIADRPGRLIVRYEDLCADPEREMRRILAAIHLPWDRQLERFIRRSTATTSPRFYGLHRKPDSVDAWRRETPRGVQERVHEIIRETSAGKFYLSR